MKLFYRKFLALFLILGFVFNAKAVHMMGGYLSYRYLSGTTYEIKLTLYRDCNSTTPFDDSINMVSLAAQVGIFDDSTGDLINTLDLYAPIITPVQPIYDSSCSLAHTNYCLEKGVYTGAVILPLSSHRYLLAYQRCCLSSTVVNFLNPASIGETYVASIPRSDLFPNSNPFFLNTAPAFSYVNQQLTFTNSAIDPDGDSLRYSLFIPFDGPDLSNPAPHPPNYPPYSPMSFLPPYSISNVMGGMPLTIDSLTGVMTAVPNSVGSFAVGVCVREFRGGQILDSSTQIVTFNIDNCNTPSGISNVAQAPSFHLSPNPASDEITITTNAQNGAALDAYVYDITGNCVATHKNISDNLWSFKCPRLSPGYYFLKVTDEHANSAVKSFIVAR